MSINYGINPESPDGMTLTIYTEMDNQLSPPLTDAINNAKLAEEKEAAEKALLEARKNWQKISFAIAKGVISHVLSNLEVYGIKTKGDVDTSVKGDTGNTNSHLHTVDLIGSQDNVEFTQSNDGIGHIR